MREVTGPARLLPIPLLLALSCQAVYAQRPPVVGPTLRSGEPPPFQGEEPKPPPPPGEILPPLPTPPPPGLELVPRVRVRVREIRVVGSTVFSSDELARFTAPYVDREVTAEDLEALRIALTGLYVDRGYVNSGAILPDQDVANGVITYQIIEGALTDVMVQGNRWFRAGYVRRRLALDAGPPLNINALQQRLQLLLEDPRFERLNAELKPGLRPGESVLTVQVEDRRPFRLTLDVDNYQPPTVGAERGIVTLEDVNVTGNGDVLTLRYGKSDGVDPLLDFKYSLPLTARDTTVSFQYRKNAFSVISEEFKALNIESSTEIYTLTLRQPLYRTFSSEFAVELAGERLSNETTLLGAPFDLLPGAVRGESVETALRIAQEWIYRTVDQVIAARSQLSVGVDALGATIHGHGQPDSHFLAWLGQFQIVRRFPSLLESQLIFRSDTQLADDKLLALEQIAVGGRYSVRGYRENTLVRDNAFLASLEARVPVVRRRPWADFIQLAPFVDYGRAWNTAPPTPDPDDLASVGIGLRWAVTLSGPVVVRPELEVYWGHPLRTVKTPGGDLQDEGVHLQLIVGMMF